MSATSTLTGSALQASRAALSAALADHPPTTTEDDDLESGEIQEVDMQAQAEGIRTVFSDPSNFNVKHPLYSPWTLWFDSPATKGRNMPQTPVSAFPQTPIPQTPGVAAAQGWMEDIKRVISFDSVEEFWGLYNNIIPPSQLPQKANYYLFKDGIIPAWEDEANKNGGKWSIQLPKDKNRGNVDKMWLYTMLAAIGETFDPSPTLTDGSGTASLITGVIVSTRPQFYRLSIWTRLAPSGAEDDANAALRERIEGVGKHFKMSVLEVHPSPFTTMPVPGFLSSFADKAQNAINASPLGPHMPASLQNRSSSPDPATQPSANEAASQGGAKSHTLESLQYQFRSLQQQYSTTTPVQKIITTEKGLAIDFDSVSRNSKAQSKELYTWGQSELEDLKDGKLAYLNFVQGSLASSLSTKLDGARVPLKALRDAEATLQPRRNIRAGLQTQISRLEHEQQKGGDKRIAEVREQLHKAELDDQHLEKEVELLKRKAIRESEQIKWDAIREYGEKLVLLSQAASPIIAVLPSIPPNSTTPYTGAQNTGAIRASLQRALDNYKTGHINLPAQATASDLSRSDTRSFGESHAKELSKIHSDIPTAPHSPNKPYPSGPASQSSSFAPSPPINPQALNQSPAPIAALSPPLAVVAPSDGPVAPLPTVAETGMPLSAGPEGPGPASGSLHDIKRASVDAGPRSGGFPGNESIVPPYGQPPVAAPIPKHESAEEEKKRLAAAYSQASANTHSDPVSMPTPSVSVPHAPQHESAEEEKKRLEREERERVLHAGGAGPAVPPKNKEDDSDLPPYQEPGV
ncbi:hypothetical protein CVT25_010192 [Psilocybe cyanescens]|uniref:Uncharacterized protein n=1 Tax=Psilocybe cyanescens TaxID=93625 RepID=A0A409XCZ1_PSICY|nr:hypothetical protein CVT25_010192 [Psilocybe cyanescens]